MIKVSGNRLSPTEIEEAALASGVVAEAVALGIPDDRLGEAIRLIVRAACGIDQAEAEGLLVKHLRADVPSWMQPREIVWRAVLPRNPNGKLDRAALQAEARA